VPRKKGLGVGLSKRGTFTKIVAVADGHSLPVAVSVQSFLGELPAQ
jgi:hypothetical protein